MLKRKMSAVFMVLTLLVLSMSVAFASAYLVNTNSGKFHKSSCRTIKNPQAAHFVAYESREACIADGYQACKVCKP